MLVVGYAFLLEKRSHVYQKMADCENLLHHLHAGEYIAHLLGFRQQTEDVSKIRGVFLSLMWYAQPDWEYFIQSRVRNDGCITD